MIRTFEEWLNNLEGFGLVSERAYDDLTCVTKSKLDHWRNIVIPWLRSAFDAGYSAGEFNKEFFIQDLKQEIRILQLRIESDRQSS